MGTGSYCRERNRGKNRGDTKIRKEKREIERKMGKEDKQKAEISVVLNGSRFSH